MRVEVRYCSRGGNTRRLAEAVAAAVGAGAATVDAPMSERADLLFLGSSVYGGKPDPEVTAFIRKNAGNIGRIVVFGSSASGRSAYDAIRATAADFGVATAEMYFHCPGSFLFFHKNRPNEKDCAEAAAFAKKQLEMAVQA